MAATFGPDGECQRMLLTDRRIGVTVRGAVMGSKRATLDNLEIRLLGELEGRRQGRVLALPHSKKTRALFGYLVATGRPHTRDRLCELFWDGPDDPKGALRWSLTKIRAFLGPSEHSRLVADREHIT